MLMEIIKLSASRRTESGKGPSNRLRRAGQIPAIAYGKGKPAVQIAIAPKDLATVLHSAHGKNAVVELDIEGAEKLTVMVRDYTYHPISRALTHADFLQVALDEAVDAQVPLRVTGKSKGAVLGATVQQIFRTIPVRSVPEKIPSIIDLDISDLDVNESIKASQLALPEGVSVRLPAEQTIVSCHAAEKVEEEPEADKAAKPAEKGKKK